MDFGAGAARSVDSLVIGPLTSPGNATFRESCCALRFGQKF